MLALAGFGGGAKLWVNAFPREYEYPKKTLPPVGIWAWARTEKRNTAHPMALILRTEFLLTD